MKHEWLIRPSGLKGLMAKGTNGALFGKTALKIIQEAVLMNKYNIMPEERTSKYTEKGIFNEKEGIKMAIEYYGWFDVDPDAIKIRISNDYLSGEPDVNTSILADIKCPFSAKTFPFFEVDPPDYEWQLQGYMDLTGKNQAELIYCLTNTPEHVILDEIQKTTYRMLTREEYSDMTFSEIECIADQFIRNQSKYDHIPLANRIKKFIVLRDDEKIKKIHQRIEDARLVYDEIYAKI